VDTAPRSLKAAFGVCICGGMSRRMGRDKAALVLGDRTLLARATGALSEVAREVVLATGSSARYRELGLRIALDRYLDAGPLAGLEGGLSAVGEGLSSSGELVVVLPCDMPRADAALFFALLERARREPDVSACLLAGNSGPEPLCGVYHTRVLHSIRAALDAGERKVLSFTRHRDASGALPRVVLVPESELAIARSNDTFTANVNTREDLAAERARWEAKESR
jgi:molybdopterin-guanine dinucleotide biosynthesis protein A